MQVFEITFHGVRGSTPCNGDEITRYGGNTSSVSTGVLFEVAQGAFEPYAGVDVLIHHDPTSTYDQVDELVVLGNQSIGSGTRVMGAREGMTPRVGL